MRRAAEFEQAVRRGVRGGRDSVVVHVATRPDADRPTVGFVVSKTVGTAVTRNLVRRRLRALVRERLEQLPAAGIVVRALPPAVERSYRGLGEDLDAALATAVRRSGRRGREA